MILEKKKERIMKKSTFNPEWAIVGIFGAFWGLSEALLGMGLRSCASYISGSLMTGAALFFIAASWAVAQRVLAVVLLVVIASLFKLFDALLLSFPIQHGAVANPIFAFMMEGAAFLFFVVILRESLKKKAAGQAILGGMSALLAVNLFPLVKYATGVPACVFPGTGYPLSLYYAPLAVFVSFITVPLGFLVGKKVEALEFKLAVKNYYQRLRYIVAPAALILCLAIIALVRLG